MYENIKLGVSQEPDNILPYIKKNSYGSGRFEMNMIFLTKELWKSTSYPNDHSCLQILERNETKNLNSDTHAH